MALELVKNGIRKIKEFLTGSKDITKGTRIVINCERLENRVALLENGVLEEFSVERVGTTHLVGSIYKGRIKNIEQGLKAMFVDIGLEKNAFLHFWDAIPEALNVQSMEEVSRGGRSGGGAKKKQITAKDIPTLYPVGSEILVQITKGPVGNKGPRVTTNISLAGRLLVLMPQNDACGISRKIEDPKERARLRSIIEKLSLPEGMGIILRTEASGKRARHVIRDLSILLEQWKVIAANRDAHKAPYCCFEEPDVFERTVRDFLTEEVDEIVCDNAEVVERMKQLVAPISGRAVRRINHFTGPGVLFEKYQVQRQINEAFFRQVWLPCGGYIVIDQTEALVSIDVNTGRNKGGGAGGSGQERVILQTNMEAAAEVARQLRLRNMGGLVVVDFIDMKSRKDQQSVYKAMIQHSQRDKAKTQILPISQFGLMEMTRQRLHESLADAMYEECPHCNGHGQIKTPLTMSVELQRHIGSALMRMPENDRDVVIVISPDVMNILRSHDGILDELQRKYLARLTFRTDPTYRREQFLIANAKTGEEVKM